MLSDSAKGEHERDDPRQARHDVQLVFGQVHGVLHVAVSEIDEWSGSSLARDSGGTALSSADVRRAYSDVSSHFGVVQAALNTGLYDDVLTKAGLGGAEMNAKKRGLWDAIDRLVGRTAREARDYLGRMRNALQWSSTLIGSAGTALTTEITRAPGAAMAAEGIKEVIDLLLNVAQSQTPGGPARGARADHGESADQK